MRNNKITGDVKDFLNAIKFMQSKEGKEQSKIMDEETVMLYNIWHKIILAECGEIYTKSKIREIRKKILATSKQKIEELQSKRIIGFDNSLALINNAEERIINNLENTISYINSIDEKELIDLILESVFISKENIEILLHKKSQMEQEKFEKLSYKGQKCVEGDTINDELLKKIYNEIKGRGLNLISNRVESTVNTNNQFLNLNKTKINAENIIIYEIYKIYEEKIEKIKQEIVNDLQKLSKSKYSTYIESENINLVRLIEQLKEEQKSINGLRKIFNKKKQAELSGIISTVDGTIGHIKTKEEYEKRIRNFEIDNTMEEIYNNTEVSKKINEQKNIVLSGTGIIINNITDDIIKLYSEELRGELDIQLALINAQTKETCTIEEQTEVEEFAKIIGMSIENALKFLKNENSTYACLFTYLFGTEVQNKLDNNLAPEILSKIDSRWKYKDKKIGSIIEQTYIAPKEQTKPIQENKQLMLKIPPKK